MTEMLWDIDKFKNLNVKPGKELKLRQHEDKLISFLKEIHWVHSQVSCMDHLKYINHLLMAFPN